MSEPIDHVILSVSDFVALVNQTFEYAYPIVTVRGELANYRVSKSRWVFFDLKDEGATVRFFGTVRDVSGPLEDGMVLRVCGWPRLHPQYGFSITVMSMQPEGEGTLRRAAELLAAKLKAEGLFDEARKRPLPYPPKRIGLITSTESAAYADFMKILHARWRGVTVECIDVQVQGEAAPGQIVAAIDQYNRAPLPPDVLVLTRGGGSTEDLYAFNTEPVARAVAASRVPVLAAIGHEIDLSLAELAADRRASTPSNAAELLVPDRREVQRHIDVVSRQLHEAALHSITQNRQVVGRQAAALQQALQLHTATARQHLAAAGQLLKALDPHAVMRRGYAIVRLQDRTLVRTSRQVHTGDALEVETGNGIFRAHAE
ncbi:MAG TPA: exodeoxyribonuclease VII large subunit [Candidatus Saccharimonadales bacterium]|nr:exodeoxyribonuclease VII large subunit [Candidatus Saccharimonadales bacterium]